MPDTDSQSSGNIRLICDIFCRIIDNWISAPDLKEVEFTGVGEFNCEKPLKLDEVSFEVKGVGEVNVADLTCNVLKVALRGVGSADIHVVCDYLSAQMGVCPRADTEVVAEAAAGMLAGVEAPRVLDLCAGTGCLGLGVKRFCPAAQVTSLEKSPAAYRYLEQNAHLSPVLTITPVRGDLFTYWQTLPEGQLDLIVSNPPYLTSAEMGALQPEVAQEPAMALEAGEDGLVFYHAIAEHYQKALRPGGALALEIGWQQREAVTALLAANGWTEIVCRKDFGGNDRCVMARKQ